MCCGRLLREESGNQKPRKRKIMTFDEFWQERVMKGTPDTAVTRTLAQAAWDTALCAASAGCFDSGKLVQPVTIQQRISDLHSWVKNEGGEG